MRTLVLILLLTLTADGMEEAFRTYWYDQGAELTRYHLLQSRYGEQREGHAVLIFVTEPLSLTKQVKSDDPEAGDAVPGLKLNHTRQFLTGIYPYHCLTTVLQPIAEVDHPHALKVTTSVQEWCGHVFEQLNHRDDGWRYRLFSYFEQEGDQDRQLPEVWLEDELWTRLRLDPSSLPDGEISLVPGAMARRFAHQRATPRQATVGIEASDEAGMSILRVEYAEIERELAITFQRDFPHAIEGWHERRGDAVTTASRTDRIFGRYWRWNGTEHRGQRRELGLPERP